MNKRELLFKNNSKLIFITEGVPENNSYSNGYGKLICITIWVKRVRLVFKLNSNKRTKVTSFEFSVGEKRGASSD